MAVSLEWAFDKDFAGFIKNQGVKLSREQLESDHYLICQSQQTKSTPGIRLGEDIVLPNNGHEYCIEIDGFANNKKSFIWVVNEKKKRLINSYIILPELVGAEQKLKSTCATFKLNEPNTQKQYVSISIGVLIGGSNPTTNDIFFIKKIKLYDNSLSQNQVKANKSQGIQITRIYENIEHLEMDLPNPRRDNDVPMEPGEYALIRCNDDSSDHGKLFVAFADPDLSSATNLKFICNITGPENIFSKSLSLTDDQIIPIYQGPGEVMEDITNPDIADKFYQPDAKTQKSSYISVNDGKIYLYFDHDGYIRWMNATKSQIPTESSETPLIEAVPIKLKESFFDNHMNWKQDPIKGNDATDATGSKEESSEEEDDIDERSNRELSDNESLGQLPKTHRVSLI